MQTKYFSNKIKTLLFLIILSNTVMAQNAKIDSLKKVLETAKDTTRVNALNELSKALMQLNSDSALLITAQSYKEAEKIHFTRGMAKSCTISMNNYRNQGNAKASELENQKLIVLAEKLGDFELLAGAYSRLGENLYGQCRYNEALEAHQKSYAIQPKIQNRDLDPAYRKAYVYNNMGYAHYGAGNYEKAYQYLKQSLDISLQLRDSLSIFTIVAYCYEALGDLYLNFDDIEMAKYYYEKSPGRIWDDEWNHLSIRAQICLKKNQYDSALIYYKEYIANHLKNFSKKLDPIIKQKIEHGNNAFLSCIYIGLKNFDDAINILEPAITYFDRNGLTRLQLASLFDITRAYIGKTNFSKALQYANELIKVAEEVKVKTRLRDGYQLLSEIYEKTGDKAKANLYYRKYAELKDQIKTDEFKQKLQLYKAEEREKQKLGAIEQLRKEKQWLSIGIILLATTVASFLAFIWVQRKSLARKKLLQQQDLALKEAENEKRIAGLEMMALRSQMNPHFIFNCLNSINRFVLRNDTEAASGYLTKFSKLMRTVLENSKQTLIPLEEEVKCLELYIQMEQFRCKNAFTYYIKYHDGVNTEEAMIPPLLLQPFVENAIWHGVNPKQSDGEIGIEFLQKEEALYCIVKDNGIGRKKASKLKSQLAANHKSMGLQITKERLAVMGINHNNEPPVEIEDLHDENGLAAGTKVTIKVFSLPAFEELKTIAEFIIF